MQGWREVLSRVVAYRQSGGDTGVYTPQPPVSFEWSSSLPRDRALCELYEICGGGEFGPMIRFIPAARLSSETEHWTDLLRGYGERGDILLPGRHVVFANEADGTPWIWDAKTGEVATFHWKGGDWEEPRFPSVDAFMEHICRGAGDDSWTAVLERALRDA